MGEVLWLRLFPQNLLLCDFQENPLLPHFSLFFCWIVEGNISKTGPLCGRDLLKTYVALLSYICFFFLLLSLLWSISHCWCIAITLLAHIAIIYIYHILVSWYCGIVTILCRARLLPSISHRWSTHSNCRPLQLCEFQSRNKTGYFDPCTILIQIARIPNWNLAPKYNCNNT